MKKAASKTYEYRVIKPDGIVEVTLRTERADLKQLQEWVGGLIQIVQILPKQWIVVNEEGAINGMPLNPRVRYNGQPLFGTVVFLPRGLQH